MHGFHAPATRHELTGEPVEQLRKQGSFAHFSKVARRADNSFSEMMLPDAGHHHAGGERILGLRQPLGKSTPAPGGLSSRGWRGENVFRRAGYREYARNHERTFGLGTAPLQKVRRDRLGARI